MLDERQEIELQELQRIKEQRRKDCKAYYHRRRSELLALREEVSRYRSGASAAEGPVFTPAPVADNSAELAELREENAALAAALESLRNAAPAPVDVAAADDVEFLRSQLAGSENEKSDLRKRLAVVEEEKAVLADELEKATAALAVPDMSDDGDAAELTALREYKYRLQVMVKDYRAARNAMRQLPEGSPERKAANTALGNLDLPIRRAIMEETEGSH